MSPTARLLFGSQLGASWRDQACKPLGPRPSAPCRRRERRPPASAERDARRRAIDARRTQVRRHEQLFGLGAPELVVILGLGAFVLGPDKLASMAKDFGKVAGELKDVPKEFKEGLEEGEAAKAARVLESGEKEEESA